ncbi:hypothetical protein R1flu_006181 [Riccia fluitans]|uniref:Uncharacterized protein n=1 Tax=Riccia fluitans TaxID=41844 RepID=A0ABD1YZC3_9MARC
MSLPASRVKGIWLRELPTIGTGRVSQRRSNVGMEGQSMARKVTQNGPYHGSRLPVLAARSGAARVWKGKGRHAGCYAEAVLEDYTAEGTLGQIRSATVTSNQIVKKLPKAGRTGGVGRSDRGSTAGRRGVELRDPPRSRGGCKRKCKGGTAACNVSSDFVLQPSRVSTDRVLGDRVLESGRIVPVGLGNPLQWMPGVTATTPFGAVSSQWFPQGVVRLTSCRMSRIAERRLGAKGPGPGLTCS